MTEPAIELTLERFRKAHEESYETALAEIRSGRKRSHWICFPADTGIRTQCGCSVLRYSECGRGESLLE